LHVQVIEGAMLVLREPRAAIEARHEGDIIDLLTETTSHESPKRGRGRPRREGADEAILAVARDLLHSRGYRDFTVDTIAERTGIAKTTIYRRWPSKGALVGAAIAPIPPRSESDTVASVLREAASVLDVVRDPEGEALEVARAVLAPRRTRICELLVRGGIDNAEQTADMLVGGLLARWLWTPTEPAPPR
jgi:AcrR family transcriptional regulator